MTGSADSMSAPAMSQRSVAHCGSQETGAGAKKSCQMHEFDLIARYFSPLAHNFPGADGLHDDAAVLSAPEGMEVVATTDTLNERVHFIGDEAPANLARKLLRVNLSDLAAKGTKPWCYLLNLSLPTTCDAAWVEGFAHGLADDQQRYNIALAGGDTTNTQGGIGLTLTAFGLAPKGKTLRRSGGKPGDLLYVTGTIGDGHLGLLAAKNMLDATAEDRAYLLERYRLPDPPVGIAPALAALAHAGMDISDGLAQDLTHLATTSNCGAEINAADIPLSDAAQHWLNTQSDALTRLLSSGDDYQLLLAIPPENAGAADALAESWCQRLTCIGTLTAEKYLVEIRDAEGNLLTLPSDGWQHRFGKD